MSDDDAELPTILEIRTHGVSGTPPDQILARPTAAADAGAIHAVPDSTAPDRGFTHLVDLQGKPVAEPGNQNHHVWAYSWGSMTSGGWKKALWALLIPFALINMAYAMLPDSSGAIAARRARAAMHLLGLALTVLFTMQVSMLVFDLVVYQCLERGEGSACLSKVPGRSLLAGEEFRLAGAGTVLLIALLVLMATITRFTKVDEVGAADAELAAAGGGGPEAETTLESQDFHDGNPLASGLRAVHGIAAPTTLVLVMTLVHADGRVGYWWLFPFSVLMALAVVLASADLRDPAAFADVAQLTPGRRTLTRVAAWTVSLAAYIAAGILAIWFLPERLAAAPGHRSLHEVSVTIQITLAISAALWAGLAISLRAVVKGQAASWKTIPDSYRPWIGGYAAGVISALGVALGAGFGAGMARAFELLGFWKLSTGPDDVGLVLPEIYDIISLMWGLTAALLLAAAVLALVYLAGAGIRALVRWVRGQRGTPPRYADTWQRSLSGMDSTTPAPGSVRRAWRLAANHDRLPTVLGGLLGLLGVALVGAVALLRPGRGTTAYVTWIQLLGTLLLLLLVGGIGWAIQRSIRSPDVGRKFGVLWDVASFWPREGHPVVPQSYATVVIHDIVTRVEREQQADPTRKIVLCGHSQGSLIMYAVVLRLLSREIEKSPNTEDPPAAAAGPPQFITPSQRCRNLSLLTYGSQLRWIYGRAFPAHLNFQSHCHLIGALDGRWINLIRPTDPVGGSVLSWDVRRNATGDSFVGEILDVTSEEPLHWKPASGRVVNDPGWSTDRPPRIRYLEMGNERWLPDPPPVVEYAFSRGHSNYVRDPAWPRFVQELVNPAAGPPPE